MSDVLGRYHELGSKCGLTHAEHHYPRVVSHIKVQNEEDRIRFAVYTGGHGHELPDPEGAREPVTYSDGCMVTPLDDGSWVMTPVTEHTPVADTAGIDAAWRERIVAALSAAEPQLREVWNQHSGAMGYVFDCTCDLCALLWVASAEPEVWQRRLDERAAALRTPKPEGER